MPEAQLDGITLWFEDDGTGPPVVLIPGMLSDSASWQPLVPALTDSFRVIRPDPRCSGRTQPALPGLSLKQMGTDILALADHLSLDRVHLVGHSLGGLVAMTATGLAPNRVASVCVLGSNPAPTLASRRVFQTLTEQRRNDTDPGAWLRGLFPWLFHPDALRDPAQVDLMAEASLAYPHKQSLAAMAHQVAFLQSPDLDSLPASLTVPAKALLAQDDRLAPLDETSDALTALGVDVDIIEAAGHALHWDQPQKVAQVVVAFLRAH